MRIAILYDCLYPNTIGGAERWYRSLAEKLEAAGHDVTYLTRVQWADEGPQTSFKTIGVSRREPLYTESGPRRIGPPLRYGWGVFWHLLRHGDDYDVVHTNVFPYFSVVGAWLAFRIRLRRRRATLVVDWFELWTRAYWIEYAGALAGRIGYRVQRLCMGLPDRSFVFSRLHYRRLVDGADQATVTRLTGLFQGSDVEVESHDTGPKQPCVVFAGRHTVEKRVTLIPDAIVAARQQAPALQCVVLGDGPERHALVKRIDELGLEGVIDAPGRVNSARVMDTIVAASCLLLPSEREGYGMVVVEAAAAGTPVVVVAGSENAAVELIEEGVNGSVAPSADADAIAAALMRVIGAGAEMRESTRQWYERHADELSLESSLAIVERSYRDLAA